ncbi:MAG TPA: proton-conducting membrane transporter [Mesorhizobium sp.]
MAYLLSQMFLLLLVALLLGLLLGWILWGRLRGGRSNLQGEIARLRSEADGLKAELHACWRGREKLEQDLVRAQAAFTAEPTRRPIAAAETTRVPTAQAVEIAMLRQAGEVTVATPPADAIPAPTPKAAPRKAASARAAAARKAAAPQPVAWPDDLRRIIGIGPVNERLLHGEEVRTFAQIARWSDAEVKRIEEVLKFDGRIEREHWIEQAKLLAAGDEVEFARRFPTANTDRNN